MTAYKIEFTDMSGETTLFTTGKITLASPVYGMSANGESVLFSHTIDQVPSTAPLLMQSEGLMRITQWWGNGNNDYVAQISPSHYIVRDIFSISISASDSPISSRNGTFTGAFTGAEEDGIMWIRWVLKENSGGSVVKDTGKIYGAVEPVFLYDSFLPGNYTATLYAETSAGVQAKKDYTFSVDYTIVDTGIPVTATRDCNGESAVSIRWPRLQSIPLISQTGTVTDDGVSINMDPGSSLMWNVVNGETMNMSAPWTAIWNGEVVDSTGATLFTITTSGNTYEVGVGIREDGDYAGRGILYLKTDNGVRSYNLIDDWSPGLLSVVLTEGLIYWRYESHSGQTLYPAENKYPSNTLYPGWQGDAKTVMKLYRLPSGVPGQEPITKVVLSGESVVHSFEILDYSITDSEASGYLTGETSTGYTQDTLFYINPRGENQDYNAGNFPDLLQSGTTIQIYRKTEESATLEYVGKTSVGAGNTILDYAARSQQGPYTYYLYVMSSEKYINIPSISNEVAPCFWNWTVLSCAENTDGSFSVQASYLFGKNLQSGTISNNNQPGVFKNFTRYPTIMVAPQNYQGGTLQSLIGVISNGEYSDTIDLRDAIYDLSTTTNVLFLKNRKGDLIRIRPSGEISMETMDNTKQQALTVSFPWAEVADARDAAIYSLGGAS